MACLAFSSAIVRNCFKSLRVPVGQSVLKAGGQMATVSMDLPDPPSSTIARLSYFVEPKSGERAFQHVNANPATGERERNFTRADHDVFVKNLRGEEDSVTLDNAGFQFHRHSAKHTSFSNDAEIEKEYYPETIELLKKLTGASRVVIFDHSMIISSSFEKEFSNYIFEICSKFSHSSSSARRI